MIPNNWNEVTLENWVALQETAENTGDSPKEILELTIKRVMLLTGCTPDEARKCPINEVSKVNKLIKTPLPTMLVKRFKLNGILYRVITRPHREPSGKIAELAADARIMTTGKVIGAMTQSDPKKWHQAVFNVCIPQKPKKFLGITYGYKDYEFEAHEIPDRIEDFKQLPLGIAHPIAVFFSRLSRAYLNYIPDYLMSQIQKMEKAMQEYEKDLQLDGDGGR